MLLLDEGLTSIGIFTFMSDFLRKFDFFFEDLISEKLRIGNSEYKIRKKSLSHVEN